ncbi:hypothetical protein IMZ48_32975 [Candidatus Bathyarchaeota archaeon]|nr:hypothetical protein [Candidatus Bathyarchaeota archaeon]
MACKTLSSRRGESEWDGLHQEVGVGGSSLTKAFGAELVLEQSAFGLVLAAAWVAHDVVRANEGPDARHHRVHGKLAQASGDTLCPTYNLSGRATHHRNTSFITPLSTSGMYLPGEYSRSSNTRCSAQLATAWIYTSIVVFAAAIPARQRSGLHPSELLRPRDMYCPGAGGY